MIYKLKYKPMEIPDAELQKNDKFYILVNLFIKKNTPDNWIDSDWRREKFACKKLTTKYSDFNFFYSLIHLQGKFNSLLGLMSKKIHNLDNLYSDYRINVERKKTYELSEKPVVVLEPVMRKAQSVMEFLDS